MDKKMLKKCRGAYLHLPATSPVERYKNENFFALLEFIGKHKCCNKRNNNIGRAYQAIISKTNELGFRGVKKYQIKTIRQYYDRRKWGLIKTGDLIIKIPYRIEFIFKAIIALIGEIKIECGALPPFCSQKYGNAFYRHHIDAYKNNYDLIRDRIQLRRAFTPDEHCHLALFDSFFAEKTPFNAIIGEEIN